MLGFPTQPGIAVRGPLPLIPRLFNDQLTVRTGLLFDRRGFFMCGDPPSDFSIFQSGFFGETLNWSPMPFSNKNSTLRSKLFAGPIL